MGEMTALFLFWMWIGLLLFWLLAVRPACPRCGSLAWCAVDKGKPPLLKCDLCGYRFTRKANSE